MMKPCRPLRRQFVCAQMTPIIGCARRRLSSVCAVAMRPVLLRRKPPDCKGKGRRSPLRNAMSPTPLALSAPLRSASTYAPFPAPLRFAQHTLPASTRFLASVGRSNLYLQSLQQLSADLSLVLDGHPSLVPVGIRACAEQELVCVNVL